MYQNKQKKQIGFRLSSTTNQQESTISIHLVYLIFELNQSEETVKRVFQIVLHKQQHKLVVCECLKMNFKDH